MYTGTLMDQLLAAVERAEKSAKASHSPVVEGVPEGRHPERSRSSGGAKACPERSRRDLARIINRREDE